jgi:hypothetical protein
MNQASITERILHLVSVNVDDPILYAGGTSKTDNDSIQLSRVPSVPEDVEDGVAKNFGLRIRVHLLR